MSQIEGAVRVGYFGKLPARGDFVRAGLPRSFVGAWDGWLQAVLPASRERLGADWLPSWLVAPVWRFRLAAGLCGAEAALGLWLPSVDRVGRYFPLMLAATGAAIDPGTAEAWLDRAERVGRAAVTDALGPEGLSLELGTIARENGVPGEGESVGVWWTEGGPHVAPTRLALSAMPDGAAFARMLRDGAVS